MMLRYRLMIMWLVGLVAGFLIHAQAWQTGSASTLACVIFYLFITRKQPKDPDPILTREAKYWGAEPLYDEAKT